MSTEQQELAEAVATWLHYKTLTGLRGLLNEASMTLPIAEFLAAKHGKEIVGEKRHPLFATGAPGRPRQIDFVRLRRGENAWLAAYECKFRTDNQTLIVADICRLVCLAQCEGIGSPDRFFVFAGKLRPGSRLIGSMFNTGNGSRLPFFDGLLLEGSGEQSQIRNSFRLEELMSRQKEAFREFASKHDKMLPSVIVTELQGWAVSGSEACGIWRVTQASGSKLLSLTDLD
jgi:hypothetical protein